MGLGGSDEGQGRPEVSPQWPLPYSFSNLHPSKDSFKSHLPTFGHYVPPSHFLASELFICTCIPVILSPGIPFPTTCTCSVAACSPREPCHLFISVASPHPPTGQARLPIPGSPSVSSAGWGLSPHIFMLGFAISPGTIFPWTIPLHTLAHLDKVSA